VKFSVSRVRRASSWRQVLPMLMLVAFALQSYVTQTHIHFAGHVMTGGFSFPDDSSKDVSGQAAGHTGDHDKYPASDDPTNCPICQEIMYAGHYVAPAAIHVILISLPASTIAIVVDIPHRLFALSHSWRGRAPPRV
jgi:hypothetical protein